VRRPPGRPKRALVTAAAAAFLAGVAAAAAIACCLSAVAHAQGDALAQLKAQFRRPTAVPFPAPNPFTEEKRALGERLWVLNNDTRTHNTRVFAPALDFDSGAQEPGETVEIAFPEAGSFLVFCGIHPKMELTVDVDP
jgi:plastocyanin